MELFQSLDDDLLETFPFLVSSPCSPSNFLTTTSALHAGNGEPGPRYGTVGEWLPTEMRAGMGCKQWSLVGFISGSKWGTPEHPRVSGLAKLKAILTL